MAARKSATAVKRAAPPTKVAPKIMPARSDFGAATESYFAGQPPEKRVLLETLRGLVLKGVPDATATIKWGVPFYERNDKSVCAIAAFKEHVGLTFFAPPSVLADPHGKLEGGGKTMRMLKVRSAKDIDAASIQRWLKATIASKS